MKVRLEALFLRQSWRGHPSPLTSSRRSFEILHSDLWRAHRGEVWSPVSSFCSYIQLRQFSRCFSLKAHSLEGASHNLPCTTPLGEERAFFSLTEDDFHACWTADSWSVNPDGDTLIDDILQGLHSPAPHSLFIIDRALRRAKKQSQSPELVFDACQYLIKDGYSFCFDNTHTDVMVHCPGIDWSIASHEDTVPEGWKRIPTNNSTLSASQIAAQILTLVVEASETQQPIDENHLQFLAHRLTDRLELTLGTDIRGRTAADTAFSLCLAGVSDQKLYEHLTYISKLEMNRVKNRSSRPVRDVLHLIEKLAAAGLRGPMVESIYDIAKESTALSEPKYQDLRATIADSKTFNLLSTRPLLWLWRFSTRQTKPKLMRKYREELHPAAVEPSANSHWLAQFDDPTKPLVLDIGCGLGVSLIGLASLRDRRAGEMVSTDQFLLPGLDWDDCNYLGGDLSLLGTRFAQAIATRWELSGHLQFTRSAAEDLINHVDTLYPGKVAMVMIQFPSPYRLKESGNTQLPSTAESGFMVTQSLMQLVSKIVKKSHGIVLLQSNCEDVAVTMRDMGRAAGLSTIVAKESVLSVNDMSLHQRTPQRTQEWIRLGGQRALGPEWSRIPFLPQGCATETEASCAVHGTPVHRCLLTGVYFSTDTSSMDLCMPLLVEKSHAFLWLCIKLLFNSHQVSSQSMVRAVTRIIFLITNGEILEESSP